MLRVCEERGSGECLFAVLVIPISATGGLPTETLPL
jgi:hypothetical protein